MNSFKDPRQIMINQMKTLLAERMPEKDCEQASYLAQVYYQQSAPGDLVHTSKDDCYGALLCLWQFIQVRQPEQVLINIYNPEPEEHHWHSTHSVIEILVEDMPFLVASILMELDRLEVHVHNLNHPVIKTQRNSRGQLLSLEASGKHKPEALMRIEVDRQSSAGAMRKIVSALTGTIAGVKQVINDWAAMAERLNEAISWCRDNPMPVSEENLAETLAFLEWLKHDNFLFVGFRYYQLGQSDEGDKIYIRKESGLGAFRDMPKGGIFKQQLSPYLAARMQEPDLLVITKSITRSTVQRPAHLDYLGIKKFDATGCVIGEWRFFGLFSSAAYSEPLEQVPVIRKKVAMLLEQADSPADSHRGKALHHVIHAYPRDEMLQASYEQLRDSIMGILDCQERRRVRMFLRPDTYDRFVTVLVYVPRDHFNTELRLKMQQILLDEMGGNSIDFNVQLSENPLAQLQFTVHCQNANELDIDIETLEETISQAMMTWQDHLKLALRDGVGEAEGSRLERKYSKAFPAAYREDVHPRQAVADIERLEKLTDDTPVSTSLYRPVSDYNLWHFRVTGQGRVAGSF